MTQLRPSLVSSTHWSGLWRLVFWLLLLTIGLRHEVGGDWFTYLEHVEAVRGVVWQVALTQGDPAYSLLNWIAAESGMGVYFTNTICAGIFAWGLVTFCLAQPRPWLALAVAIPYLVMVVAMGYTRQGVAIGLAMMGLVALSDRKVMRFVVFVALAATFHKSAVILMPLAILAGTQRKIWTLFWVALSSVLFYVLLLQESVDSLKSGYLEAEYQSDGAAIRIAMNALPAILFLALRKRFVMLVEQRVFWTWMSLFALGFVVMLQLSSSSTAVDRVALYWIPLQLFVWSRLPNALGARDGLNSVLVTSVVLYSAAVLLIWLFFADNAFAWLPYQFYPFVLLFG